MIHIAEGGLILVIYHACAALAYLVIVITAAPFHHGTSPSKAVPLEILMEKSRHWIVKC